MKIESWNGLSRREAIKLGTATAASALLDLNLRAGQASRKVVAWSEGTANVDPASKKVYPDDINTAIAEGLAPLKAEGWEIVKASLNDDQRDGHDHGRNPKEINCAAE